MYTARYKADSSAPSPRKQATTHKHAGSKATNPQTLFQALCLRRPFTRERVKPPPLFEIILPGLLFPERRFWFAPVFIPVWFFAGLHPMAWWTQPLSVA